MDFDFYPLLFIVHQIDLIFSSIHMLNYINSQFRVLQQNMIYWVAYRQQEFISHILDIGSLRSRCEQSLYLVRACFLVCTQMVILLLCNPVAVGGEGSLWGPFEKGMNPTHENLHPHDLTTPQMPHLLMPPHWDLGFQHVNFGRP